VFDEIVPSVIKHGAYMTEATLERYINNPDFAIGLLTAT
jgi:prophage antirepressor-like protein